MTKGFFLGGDRILRRPGEGEMGKLYHGVHDGKGRKAASRSSPRRTLEEQYAWPVSGAKWNSPSGSITPTLPAPLMTARTTGVRIGRP